MIMPLVFIAIISFKFFYSTSLSEKPLSDVIVNYQLQNEIQQKTEQNTGNCTDLQVPRS